MPGGSWFGWADWTLGNRSPVECEKQKTLADEALNKAWYATRVYEMYFPTMKPAADAMRLELSRCKNEAERQISGGGSFDGSRFSEKYHVVDLDVVVDKSRKILGFPSE